MAKKRFTDIEIWDREWYMELKPVHKCLMKYIFDKCDASGCWKPNWKLASLHIGEDVQFADLSKLPKDQYEVLESGKIFIPDFIKFQYGTLSKKSPAHNPVFLAIEKNNLPYRVLDRVLYNPKEEEEYKEKEKDKEKEKEKEQKKNDFNTMPVLKNFNGLPEGKMGAAKELVRITSQNDVSEKQVRDIWEVFKIQNLTGKKYYANEDAVYSHFINWIKTQKFTHGKSVDGSGEKLGTSAARIAALKKW